MKTFCFTVDDNIRFLKELTFGDYNSIFDHPYMAMYKRLHDRFGLKVQLNLFYRTEGFELSQMTEKYSNEWREHACWLKLSFHSDMENEWPYTNAGYDEVFRDCANVHGEIVRFASQDALAKTTTVHFCSTTKNGVQALRDSGIIGLLGLFGDEKELLSSYALPDAVADEIRGGKILQKDGMSFAPIDLVINTVSLEEGRRRLEELLHRDHIWIMIHEQYFYSDYPAYQSDFEEKVTAAVSLLCGHGYKSRFFEELI